MKITKLFAVLALTLGFSVSYAQLTDGASYYTGQVKVSRAQPTTCYVELLFSRNMGQVQARSISTLPHLSASGTLTWIAVGPFTANYSMQRSHYRYQDPTPRALVRDLVVNVTSQGVPLKHSILYWHVNHHDPVTCEGLVEKTSAQDLREVEQAFARFDELKP